MTILVENRKDVAGGTVEGPCPGKKKETRKIKRDPERHRATIITDLDGCVQGLGDNECRQVGR
jgi:hypothetical protein